MLEKILNEMINEAKMKCVDCEKEIKDDKWVKIVTGDVLCHKCFNNRGKHRFYYNAK